MSSQNIILRARSQLCALPVATVIETMRPQPIVPLAGLPPWVLGMAVIRGESVPVVDLGVLLEVVGQSAPRRFVLLRTAGCPLALAVEDVVGIDDLDKSTLTNATPLFGHAADRMAGQCVKALAVHHRALLAVLDSALLLPDGTLPAVARAMP